MLVLIPDHEAATRLDGIEGIELSRPPWPLARRDEVEAIVLPVAPAEIPDLSGFPRLRLAQALTAGVDNVLVRVPPGVILCDAQGVHDIPLAEWVVTAVLTSFRRFPEHAADQLRQRWPDAYPPYPVREVSGSRIAIVGAGSVGTLAAERLEALGAGVERIARRPRAGVVGVEALDRLLPEADAVVVLVPLTEATRGMFDRERLASLKDGATFINAARGQVVDQDALEAELRATRLRAVLDVTEPEPLPAKASLWDAPGVLITPHVGGISPLTWQRAYDFVADQLIRLRDGRPPRNVVGSEGY
jgi:phosphoglycerate dehydrogenase-like enzyme